MRYRWLITGIILALALGLLWQVSWNCSIINWCKISEIVFGAAATVGLGGLLAGGIQVFYRIPKYNKQEDILHKLAIMRTDGVRLRNQRPEEVFSNEEIEGWFEIWTAELEMWEHFLYKKAAEFSKVEAERLKTLDTVPSLSLPGVVTPDQRRTLLITSETLKRLDKLLEQRFRPKQSP